LSTPLGTYRHLTQCSTENGHFVVLAIDHRANLLDALNQSAGKDYSDKAFSDFKLEVVDALIPDASALLIDPAYGMARGIAKGIIGTQHGILLPLEVTNYNIHPSERELSFIKGWSIEKLKYSGGTGVKLLLNYHPDAETAPQKHEMVRRIIDDCKRYEIPFFLEPIAYALPPNNTLTSKAKRRIVIKSAKTFAKMGVDVLKVEFPALPTDNEATWQDAVTELNAACGDTPWVLLSAGVAFETFRRQTEFACKAGASGVIVGRAVWAEAVTLQAAERHNFLQGEAKQRIKQLTKICADHATDWRTKMPPPNTAFDWYQA